MVGKEGRKKVIVNKWVDILKVYIFLFFFIFFGYRIFWDFCELGVDRVFCVFKEMIFMVVGCSIFGIYLFYVF